ncbi:hypothetical protein [Malaciobacter marinus]
MQDIKKEEQKIDIEKIPFWDILKILKTSHIMAIIFSHLFFHWVIK